MESGKNFTKMIHQWGILGMCSSPPKPTTGVWVLLFIKEKHTMYALWVSRGDTNQPWVTKKEGLTELEQLIFAKRPVANDELSDLFPGTLDLDIINYKGGDDLFIEPNWHNPIIITIWINQDQQGKVCGFFLPSDPRDTYSWIENTKERSHLSYFCVGIISIVLLIVIIFLIIN